MRTLKKKAKDTPRVKQKAPVKKTPSIRTGNKHEPEAFKNYKYFFFFQGRKV